MKGDRNLDESLPDFFLFVGRGPPHIFQDLVSIEKSPLVEQRDSMKVFVLVCGHIRRPRRKENLAPEREVSNTLHGLGAEDPVVGTGSHEE